MDGFSIAASVIAVVDVSVKVTALCSQYIAAVKDAENDIKLVRKKVEDIIHTLKEIEKLLDRPQNAQLSTTHGLFKSLDQCLQQLKQLEKQLEPRKIRKFLRWIGFQALKWPFTSKQVKDTLSSLESYNQSFSLALNVDQMNVMLNMDQKVDLATQDIRTLHRKLDLTALPIAEGASFNSLTEQNNARCLDDTRNELRDEIETWANNKEGKSIFWLSGMAGTGKSTIARTVAESFSKRGQLGASFFFKKGEGERGNASRFFTTIANELMVHERDIRPSIRTALDEDPAISQRALKDQFEKLILQPLLGIQQVASQAPARIVVIDALDECEKEQDIRTILQLLAHTKDIQPIPLRVFVTSRPELHIRLGFKDMPNGTYQDVVLHKVPKSTIEHDIEVFLKHELGAIQKKRMLSPDWPTANQIRALVDLAEPLFIYAATVCRYVGTKGSNPKAYLDKVLQYRKATFSQLDRTYLPVLDQLLIEQEDDEREMWLQTFRELVGSIVVLESPLSITSLSRLLQDSPEEIKCRLDSLHSVLSIPDSEDVPIRLLHLSFREFLVDPQKQGKSSFWVDERSTHKKLASYCLKLMSGPSGLHQDMCSLSAPGVLRGDIDEGTVADSLLPDLKYACRYWITHLKHGNQNLVDGDTTQLFLQEHLLHWFEAMSLMKELGRCIHLLDDLQALAGSSAKSVSDFLRDAKRFVLRFQSVITDTPLQIYCSALAFAPETSLVRRTFADKVRQEVDVVSKREVGWDACRSTLEGHSWEVTAVAFSPNGQLVASASNDKKVRVWDVVTGTCSSMLEGHSGWVTAVAFSKNGQVASASTDKTVRVWDVVTETCSKTLKDHSSWVTAVAFSLDGRLVASASDDKTVWLWDVATETCIKTLSIHSDWVTVVAFSPYEQLAAWASGDKTVQMWDAAKGAYSSTLRGHYGYVRAVAFSPDGLVATASNDETVRVWEAATGKCIRTLKGHSDWVTAVAFSPDGRLVASASNDKEVRLWVAATGECRSILESHSASVTAVAFSPDGRLIASSSDDRTVRLWDSAIEGRSSMLEGHSDKVTAVAFSPDGQLVASASNDEKVRVWVAATGECLNTLKGHSDEVKAVAFSSDGRLIASASDDQTVRIWKAMTGKCIIRLETHSVFITAVAFSSDGQTLETDVGEFPVPFLSTVPLPSWQQKQPSNILVQGQWILRNQQRFLWLPSEYRTQSVAVHEDMICLGLVSGRVVLLKIT